MNPEYILVVLILLVLAALFLVPWRATPSDSARSDLEARRFARLLVAEIKLNNRALIQEGQENRDLYRRLKEEIDRAGRTYDRRVNKDVAERVDYFYDEVVKELAGGDASALGADYRRGRK